jgi:ATP-dependent Lon protease
MESASQLAYNLRPRNEKHYGASDNNGSSSSDEEYDPTQSEDGELDDASFKKFLHKMFPSKHLKSKIKEMDAITEKMDKAEAENPKVKKNIKGKKKPKVLPKVEEKNESECSSDESEYDDEIDEDEEYEEKGVINIVLNINDMLDEDDDYYDDDETEDESEDESDDESEDESKDKDKLNKTIREKKDSVSEKKKKDKSVPKIENVDNEKALLKKIEESFAMLSKEQEQSHVFAELKKFTAEQKEIVTKQQEKVDKKSKQKNMKDFRSLINERKTNNEITYFNKLELSEQNAILEKMREANKLTKMVKPYRFKLIDMDLPDHIKAIALKKMSTFQKMEPDSSEYFKMKNWIDAFMSIPFNTYTKFDISLKNDGPEKCRDFMTKTSKIMDDAVYGLNDAKMQIMQMIGTWISNPEAVGNAIAIKGPPGTGKTTLVKEGVSKVLNRPFSFIALGGSTDSSFLEGHSYTYEGSTWGKIVSILMESKCMNPVIYFDELDKVSDTPKGEEIIGILTHLIDTSQNSEFHDKYFSDIKLDLSKCLFIFSYNDESKINPILKDRMYKIETKGYNAKEKAIIAQRHLIPSIQKQIGITSEELIITDEVLSYLIQSHTGDEKGVRTLKRCLEIIFTKINLSRFTDSNIEIFKDAFVENIEFPYTITNRDVDKMVIKGEQNPYLTTLYT